MRKLQLDGGGKTDRENTLEYNGEREHIQKQSGEAVIRKAHPHKGERILGVGKRTPFIAITFQIRNKRWESNVGGDLTSQFTKRGCNFVAGK